MIQPSLFDTQQRELFEQVASIEQLAQAYGLVKANKGAAGVDGVSIQDFGTRLQEEVAQLSQEVLSWQYEPKPVKRVRIAKPDGSGERLIGIPTIRDRVLQQSLKISLEPMFDAEFSKSSFGFRPKRGPQQAIAQAQKQVKEGKEWIVDIDLEKFFDTISQDRIVHRLGKKVADKRILRLVGMTLRSGILEGGNFTASAEGSVQGSPLSPLLSNIILDELDKELETRNLSFCRYADDCNIFVGSQKAAERVMASISRFIEKRLKLKINQNKSKVAKAGEVKFLGMTILDGVVAISAKSMRRAMAKVKELIPRASHLPWEERIRRINQWYIGWSAYYRMTQLPSQLRNIEAHIRRRLRSQWTGEQKRRKFLFHHLVKMGVSEGLAANVFRPNQGRWKLSHSKAVEKAWSNEWFARLGLKTISDSALPHWLPLTVWKRIL